MKRTDGPFSVYEILPGELYQRGKLHSLSRDVKARGLDYYGITHAVALAPRTADPDLSDLLDYTHHPIPDGLLRENGAYLRVLAQTLSHKIENEGACVLTMCNAGRNRSGLLSALIVRNLSRLPGASAMDVVREHRPNALANPYFEKFLLDLP